MCLDDTEKGKLELRCSPVLFFKLFRISKEVVEVEEEDLT